MARIVLLSGSLHQAGPEWLAARAEPVAEIRTSEDVVVSAVGRELYGYGTDAEVDVAGCAGRELGTGAGGLRAAS